MPGAGLLLENFTIDNAQNRNLAELLLLPLIVILHSCFVKFLGR